MFVGDIDRQGNIKVFYADLPSKDDIKSHRFFSSGLFPNPLFMKGFERRGRLGMIILDQDKSEAIVAATYLSVVNGKFCIVSLRPRGSAKSFLHRFSLEQSQHSSCHLCNRSLALSCYFVDRRRGNSRGSSNLKFAKFNLNI